MHRKVSFLFVSLAAIIALVMVNVRAARADEVSHARIVRLSFVEGDVAYQSGGSNWQRAMMNLPIQQDFSLRTDAGYAEVEFETGLVIRLAQNTQIHFTDLSLVDGRKVTALKLDQGTVVATANLQHNDEVSISTGNLKVTVPHNGRFRVDATDSQDWVSVLHGKVEVANGQSTTELESGKALHFGGAAATASVERSPDQDAFDKWVTQRDQAEQNSQTNAGEFVSQRNYAYNVGDLYNYGLWFNMPGYGMVWQPYGLGAGWMPFGSGQWMLGDPSMGWMWTSFEPWGWLPYHYGGWVNVAGGGWFWVPQNLGTFHAATANFVTVGNQMGWTPTIAPPTNPGKVKGITNGPVQVVFAGGASKGVIEAGPRGQLNSGSTLKTTSAPGASFSQAGPTISSIESSGVKVTGRPAIQPMSTARVSGAHGTLGTSAGSQAKLSGPTGRPTMVAPHSSAAPVVRAPSTFAGMNAGGAGSSGVARASGGSTTAPSKAAPAAPAAGGGVKGGGGAAPIKH